MLKSTSIFNSNPEQFLTALPENAVGAFNSIISAIIDEEAPQEDRDSFKKRATHKGTFFNNKFLQNSLKIANAKTNSMKISNKNPISLTLFNKPSTPLQRQKTPLDKPKNVNKFQLNVLIHQHCLLQGIWKNLCLYD